MFNIDKKTVYVLNGMSPEKLDYFNRRKERGIKCICMHNNGDNYNTDNFRYLMENHILDDKNNYVLITAEYQLEYIQNNKNVLRWYQDHYSNILCLKHTYSYAKPNYLGKLNIYKELKKKHNHLIDHCKIMNGKEFLALPKDEQLNHILKYDIGAGSGGIFVCDKKHRNPKLDMDTKYLVEKIIPYYDKSDEYTFYTCVVCVNKGVVSFIVENYNCTPNLDTSPYANGMFADFTKYGYLKEKVESIVEDLGITDGCFEPEIIISNDYTHAYLIDLNPRWSLDHSCMQAFSRWLPKGFDMLSYYMNGKPFKDTVENKMCKYPKGKPLYMGRQWVELK